MDSYIFVKKIDGKKTSHKSSADEYTNPNEIYIFEKDNELIALMKVSEDNYTIFDGKYIDNVVKYSWHVNALGYVNHTICDKSSEDLDEQSKNIYFHKFIKKYCQKDEQNENTIDHINWYKLDNRECNLRWTSQGNQNINRKTRRDKIEPFDELKKLGIIEYPPHIRYDKSDNKFVIEKHPLLLEKGIKQINSSKSSKLSIIEKYKDILIKGIELEKSANDEFEKIKIYNYLSCLDIVNMFNKFMNDNIMKLPQNPIKSSYADHFNILFPEESQKKKDLILEKSGEFILYQSMLPQYSHYKKPDGYHGSQIVIEHHPQLEKRSVATSSSILKTIKEKYIEFMKLYDEINEKTKNQMLIESWNGIKEKYEYMMEKKDEKIKPVKKKLNFTKMNYSSDYKEIRSDKLTTEELDEKINEIIENMNKPNNEKLSVRKLAEKLETSPTTISRWTKLIAN